MKTTMVIVGIRPEIIKMAPIVRALKNNRIPITFGHCSQHYDYNMWQQFIEELELPAPDYGYKVEASSLGEQTARIIANMDKLLKKTVPYLVLVEGDTNSMLTTALVANKRGIFMGHVEAGFAKVVGTEKPAILAAIAAASTRRKELLGKSPFGGGNAAEKIVGIIGKDFFSAQDI